MIYYSSAQLYPKSNFQKEGVTLKHSKWSACIREWVRKCCEGVGEDSEWCWRRRCPSFWIIHSITVMHLPSHREFLFQECIYSLLLQMWLRAWVWKIWPMGFPHVCCSQCNLRINIKILLKCFSFCNLLYVQFNYFSKDSDLRSSSMR